MVCGLDWRAVFRESGKENCHFEIPNSGSMTTPGAYNGVGGGALNTNKCLGYIAYSINIR
jgi:hypothetical protein